MNRRKINPKVKFKYGYDINVYLDMMLKKLQATYHWAKENHLDKHYTYAIEEIDGEKEFVEYYKAGKGKKEQTVLDDIETADQFIDRLIWLNEYNVMAANPEIAEFKVDYAPHELLGDWNLEHYIFYKLKTGDYKVDVQAGDRTSGANRTFFIPPKTFKAKTYDKFLDQYLKIVPPGAFGLNKEDLLQAEGLKEFLGY